MTLVVEVTPGIRRIGGLVAGVVDHESGSPNVSSSSGVGRISRLCMNSAWYARAQMTRTFTRYAGSQPAKPSTT